MFNHWNELERTWATMEALRRGMDQAFSGAATPSPLGFGRFVESARSRGPRLDVYETEDGYLVTADLPGFEKSDLEVSFAGEQLVLSAKRNPKVPEGYQVVMEERGAIQFTRTIAFPSKVDAERIEAKLTNGVLEVRVPKHAEAKPRQIPISLGS